MKRQYNFYSMNDYNHFSNFVYIRLNKSDLNEHELKVKYDSLRQILYITSTTERASKFIDSLDRAFMNKYSKRDLDIMIYKEGESL